RAELVRAFGKEVLPTATAAGASAASTVAVPVPATSAQAEDEGVPQRGWELAHWAVAQSEALRIERVSYADRVWEAGRGWRTDSAKGSETGTATVGIRVAQ
ncbi:hypothetical protein G3I27_14285, partial [Streptomyces sp. SID10692]|nr:hypothetical protein [Streptomyces sp. SID10692]